jgi:hypothetical protein
MPICAYNDSEAGAGYACPLDTTVTCRGTTCVYYDPPTIAEGRNLSFAKTARPPIIGPGPRTHSFQFHLNRWERDALDRAVIARRCLSRADYLRYIIECEHTGALMVIDDAFARFCAAIGQGFGGAAAELTAQADRYRLTRDMHNG